MLLTITLLTVIFHFDCVGTYVICVLELCVCGVCVVGGGGGGGVTLT